MRYTYVKQHDATDCAAACLAMVCLHYKKETTITKLRDMMGTDLKGTNLIGLSKCASKLGFTNQAVRVDKEGLLSEFTLPAIANLYTKEGYNHFVIIFKKTKKYLVIGDPAKNIQRITVEEFYKSFTGILLILKPNESFVSGKVKKEKVVDKYIRLLWPQRKLMLYGIITSAIMMVLGILTSIFNNIIYDEVLPYRQENLLNSILSIFIGINIVQITISFIRGWLMMHLSLRIDIPLMLGYFEHIYKLPMKFFATRKIGDITTRFTDAFTIKDIFTNLALTLFMDILMAFFSGFILANMNPNLFLIIIFMTIVNIMLVFAFKQPYKRINEEQMQQSATMNSEIIEGLRAIETIKANAIEDVEMNNIEREYIKSLRIGYKEGMLSNIQGIISGFISSVGNLVLTYYGILEVMNGNITLGSMMAFMTLAGYFMDPVGRLVSLQLSIQEVNISMKRISEILDYETEILDDENKNDIEKIEGDIKFDNVVFRYGNREPAINQISFDIPKGKKVAIVGASGSGKSTIVKLLLRYYDVESGSITIDGVNIKDYTNKSIRHAISYVPQNIELFSKSIYENIRISNFQATLDDVKRAAKKADAHEFIRGLPLQYNTILEEAGNGLSGGEKQRIALARAFIKEKNNFFILDESTSNLDFATENVIFDMIYNQLADKTMLIVAHRLATVKQCDNIIVLEHGCIVEQGKHEELLEKQGQYYKLWNMQQGNIIKKQSVQKNVKITDVENDEEIMSYL